MKGKPSVKIFKLEIRSIDRYKRRKTWNRVAIRRKGGRRPNFFLFGFR